MNDQNKTPAESSAPALSVVAGSACFVCGKPRENGKRERRGVCREHFMVECPKCGHEAFWLETKVRPNGRWVCFSLSCLWQDDKPEELGGKCPVCSGADGGAMCCQYEGTRSGYEKQQWALREMQACGLLPQNTRDVPTSGANGET